MRKLPIYIAQNTSIKILCQNNEISSKVDLEEMAKVDNAINII